MNDAPLISVLVTCYRLGPFLREAIESVLDQDVDDVEILVIDDGSDDPETLKILEEFEAPRTRIYRTANRGLAKARNRLIEEARGTYLCALDADDRLRPGFFRKALRIFESRPEIVFVSSWLQAFGEENWVWRQERCDLEALLAEDTVMTAALVRSEAVRQLGGYDEEMPHQGDEDWDLWIRLAAAGHQGFIIPEVLFDYRRRPSSMGSDCVEGEVHLQLWKYLLEKHAELYRKHLFGVLSLKEKEVGEYLRTNDRLDRELSHLRKVLENREDWLLKLKGRIESAKQTEEPSRKLDEQIREYQRCRAEVEALRSSLSWKLTAPLRLAADWLGGRFRGSGS